jgi:hypothetical protein
MLVSCLAYSSTLNLDATYFYKIKLIFEGLYDVMPITVTARLRHELSSLARALGSWVRIPLKAWMSVCFYSVFVLSFEGSGLATG